MEFITTDGKLEIKDNKLIQKRLTNERRRNAIIAFYFFLFFINEFVKQIDKLNVQGKQSAWVGLVLYVIPILSFVIFVIYTLVRQILKNNLQISRISELILEDTELGLEKYLLVKTGSKRFKLYKFRNLEKEYDRLIEHLKAINPSIKVIA
jgi:hypothetical protein